MNKSVEKPVDFLFKSRIIVGIESMNNLWKRWGELALILFLSHVVRRYPPNYPHLQQSFCDELEPYFLLLHAFHSPNSINKIYI
jgi:hypothetical protein